MLPFQLDLGLYLEHIETLVPWGTAVSDLQRFGSPVVTQKAGAVFTEWRGSRCLGGLICKVCACRLVDPAGDASAYHIFLPEFHWADLTLGPNALTRDLLRRAFRHLDAHLGPPHFFYADYYAGLPSIWWELDTMRVRVGPVYGADLGSVTLQHEPAGFEEVKRQAAAWRAEHGVGARENYKAGAVAF